jgi:hypothetical protein
MIPDSRESMLCRAVIRCAEEFGSKIGSSFQATWMRHGADDGAI